MRALTLVVMILSLFAIIAQYAPMVGAYERSEAAKEVQVAQQIQKEVDMVQRCANGTTNVIMYKGVMCKR